MSVFRFLSPARRGSPSSSTSPSNSNPTLAIHVPSYGSIYMAPTDPSSHPDHHHPDHLAPPPADKEFRGEIEITLPRGYGVRRVKGIKVGLKSTLELQWEGKWERDVIFERHVEIGGEAGLILEEGVQRYDFTLLIPPNLASHDILPDCRLEHTLYAEVIGDSKDDTPTSSTPTAGPSRGRTPRHRNTYPLPQSLSQPSSRSRSRQQSPPDLPSPSSPASSSRLDLPNPYSLALALENSMSLTRCEEDHAPPYELHEGEEGVEWLKGTLRAKRLIEVLHNINPMGGITDLDMRASGAVDGLGVWELKIVTDCFTSGALLLTRLHLPSPSSKTTIYHLRTTLQQAHTITSPRRLGTAPQGTTQKYKISELGDRPGSGYVSLGWPAVWRGESVGGGKRKGEDVLGWDVNVKGRMPDDMKMRPTSVPGVASPITIKHKLVFELFFSVYGEDVQGKPIPMGGPGEMRVLIASKGVQVASCGFTPEELRLPIYGSIPHIDAFSHLSRTCPLCQTHPSRKLCTACPPSALPHPRHDHSPKMVGNDAGICMLCVRDVVPTRGPTHEDCACGMGEGYLWDRMRKSLGLGDGEVGREGGDGAGAAEGSGSLRSKEEVERGRRR